VKERLKGVTKTALVAEAIFVGFTILNIIFWQNETWEKVAPGLLLGAFAVGTLALLGSLVSKSKG